ncbi:MAG: hypothetical protein ISP86_02740 [Shewanellaceae bacterium]|nr:hypothetical protein [Shewanellaceae bacterium]
MKICTTRLAAVSGGHCQRITVSRSRQPLDPVEAQDSAEDWSYLKSFELYCPTLGGVYTKVREWTRRVSPAEYFNYHSS